MKKLKIISEDNGKVIVKIIFNVTLPSLILNVLSSVVFDVTLLLLPMIPLMFSSIVLIVCYFVFRSHPKDIKSMIFMTVIGFNMGNFAYPLIESIWGEAGLRYIVFFDIGNALVIFIVIGFIASFYSEKQAIEGNETVYKTTFLRVVKSPPLIAVFIALIVNLSGLTIPLFIQDFLDILSRANMALTLLSLGIFLNFRFEKTEWKTIGKILVIRYSFGLMAGLFLFFILPFPLLYRTIVLISLILPMAMGTILFAVEYGHDEKIAGMIGNITLIISFVMMWIIILIIGVI
ncbi:MAG: AEC family transporter [Candidatus Lokiarchaeota archaeon]|nr:AEC family transporter [Candidatus Lokiarchaeota archaeon]